MYFGLLSWTYIYWMWLVGRISLQTRGEREKSRGSWAPLAVISSLLLGGWREVANHILVDEFVMIYIFPRSFESEWISFSPNNCSWVLFFLNFGGFSWILRSSFLAVLWSLIFRGKSTMLWHQWSSSKSLTWASQFWSILQNHLFVRVLDFLKFEWKIQSFWMDSGETALRWWSEHVS